MNETRMTWKGRALLYRAFDATGRLIYIGQSIDLPRRIAEHGEQHWWWNTLVHRLRIQVHPNQMAAKAAERVAIREETPVFNQMGYSNWRDNPYWSEADHELHRQWRADRGYSA